MLIFFRILKKIEELNQTLKGSEKLIIKKTETSVKSSRSLSHWSNESFDWAK